MGGAAPIGPLALPPGFHRPAPLVCPLGLLWPRPGQTSVALLPALIVPCSSFVLRYRGTESKVASTI